MTDTSGGANNATQSSRPVPSHEHRFKFAIALRSPEGRENLLEKAAVWDSPAYAFIVAIGVPIMGWSMSGWFTDTALRASILAFWLFWNFLYWYIEVREILAQIRKYGVLQRDESDAQRSSMQSLYWGALIAFLAFAIPLIIYIVTSLFSDKPINAIPHYGPFEWAIIAHTVLTGRFTILALYAVISEFQEALAFQRRREQQTAPH